ncbi:hypothetical protein NBH81_20535 [Aeromonas veronii]|uniref:hypothetical protein n=1 Tax=Aeromonas veronii TaxID=654 RepID=UPI0021D7FB3E|nr:hypothetical protein [Aeromonas veronii]UYB70673.1 hypothetical protein NBH81_20535 [Aeromonas veronii]
MKRVAAASLLLLATSAMAISATEKTAVIDRCKDQMNQYGATMVKACVDQDLEAYELLNANYQPHEKIVKFCVRTTKQFGWNMVKACADQNIEARQAIVSYQEKYAKYEKILDSCVDRMGKIGGWVMIKACTDQDIKAEQALSQY